MSYRAIFVIGLLAASAALLLDRELDSVRAQAVTTTSFSTSSLSSTSTSMLVFNTSTSTSTTSIPAGGVCGDPTGDGSVAATDALFALAAAVGTQQCDLCLCDVDNSGSVAATDALVLLQVAVGQQLPLLCPPC